MVGCSGHIEKIGKFRHSGSVSSPLMPDITLETDYLHLTTIKDYRRIMSSLNELKISLLSRKENASVILEIFDYKLWFKLF